jgi:hypothetical protein
VGVSFSAGVRIGRESRTPRSIAVIGIVAILFQAMLFGWHSHALSFSSCGAPWIADVAAGGPETPAAADRDCEICFALSHHGAVPVDVFAPALPEQTVLQQVVPAPLVISLAAYFLFRSRAPPGV